MNTKTHNQNKPFAGATLLNGGVDKPLASGFLAMEVWKKVKSLDDKYEVSNFGNIRSVSRFLNMGNRTIFKNGILLKHSLNNRGYKCVSLFGKKRLIHRLVV